MSCALTRYVMSRELSILLPIGRKAADFISLILFYIFRFYIIFYLYIFYIPLQLCQQF